MSDRNRFYRYIYFSDRRAREILDNRGLALLEKRNRKISTPNIRGYLPSVEWGSEAPALTRVEIADKVDRAVAKIVVDDLNSYMPVVFAKGSGWVVYGESHGRDSQRAIIHTSQDLRDGGKVAVCLFGSMENYADFVVDAGPRSKDGWTCSSDLSVYRYLEKQGRIRPSWESEEELARAAVKIACCQGEHGSVPEPIRLHAWNRGFTYGDIRVAGEWLAEIYLDYDLNSTFGGSELGYTRVLIGAPVWVRTLSPDEIRLYSQHDPKELDAALRPSVMRRLMSGSMHRFKG